MTPKNFQFGGGAADTVLNPLVAAGLLIAIALILALPRKKAIVPFLLAFFTIPIEQVVVLGGVHFTVLRILILTVLGRMAAFHATRSDRRFGGGFNSIDRAVVLWSLSAVVIFSLQWMEIQAVIKVLGDLTESLGGYLAVRFLIPDRETIRRALKAMAAVCVIQGACMVSEQFTHHNVFEFLGAYSSELREGHIRSQGVLGGLYAGPFASFLLPLFIWLAKERKCRIAAYVGIIGATAMVFASHASTSWIAYGASLIGLGFWPLRKRMRIVRWAIVGILVGLHLVMHGPVWSLIEKIDLTGGSSSYHRYMLLDNCIRHFGDWWLLGTKTYVDWGFVMFDVCNQFVLTALRGGLVTLVIYLAIYKRSFGAIGRSRKRVEGDRKAEWFMWCLGASLLSTVVASFGINFMVHLQLCFLCLLACISVATFEMKQLALRRAETGVEPEFAPLAEPVATSVEIGGVGRELGTPSLKAPY